MFRLFYRPFPWWNYVITFLLAILFFAACAVIFAGKAIGGGDMKSFGMIALGFGMTPYLIVLCVSHLCATIFLLIWKVFHWQRVNKDTTFPFAPFLLVGFCFHIFLYN
jgi:prepilin signal peptidase PulO-like enzyme (type II secretory pathway)